MNTKTCTKCGTTGGTELFLKSKNLCRKCNSDDCKEYKLRKADQLKEYNKKYRVEHSSELKQKNIKWNSNNRDKKNKHNLEYKKRNRETLNNNAKEYYLNNKESVLKYHSERYKQHREEIIKKQAKYREENKEAISNRIKIRYRANIVKNRLDRNRYLKHLRTTNENYRISISLRGSLKKALRQQSIVKDFRSGVSASKARDILKHIGPMPEKGYHLDHIIPISKFNLRLATHREMANSKFNLRWLPATDNLVKNDTIDVELIKSIPELVTIAHEIGLSLLE